jgi:hypothetical protein
MFFLCAMAGHAQYNYAPAPPLFPPDVQPIVRFASYAMGTLDATVAVNCSSNCTLTLPSCRLSVGRTFKVVNFAGATSAATTTLAAFAGDSFSSGATSIVLVPGKTVMFSSISNGSGGCYFNGGEAFTDANPRVVTANYSMTSLDLSVSVSCTAGCTVTLPTCATSIGQVYKLFASVPMTLQATSVNIISVQPAAGDSFASTNASVMLAPGAAARFVAVGTNAGSCYWVN